MEENLKVDDVRAAARELAAARKAAVAEAEAAAAPKRAEAVQVISGRLSELPERSLTRFAELSDEQIELLGWAFGTAERAIEANPARISAILKLVDDAGRDWEEATPEMWARLRREIGKIASSRRVKVYHRADVPSGTISIPPGRFEHLSRGRGWCQSAARDFVNEKNDAGDYVIKEPGRYTVGSSDGYNRKESVSWVVRVYTYASVTVWTAD